MNFIVAFYIAVIRIIQWKIFSVVQHRTLVIHYTRTMASNAQLAGLGSTKRTRIQSRNVKEGLYLSN